MGHKPLLIKNVNIYLEHETVTKGAVLFERGFIQAIYTNDDSVPKETSRLEIIDGDEKNLVPGFIDSHIHGAGGADVMDATEEALDKIAETLPKEGTTSFLPTTMTQSISNIEQALENLSHYETKTNNAEMIGIHLEGPFVNKVKAGAQPVEHIIEQDLELFKKWQRLAKEKIKTITLAPEFDQEEKFISYLNEIGVNVSAGHTDVNYDGLKKAVDKGVHQVTHLCNAMNGIHHRDIGAVGGTFYLEDLKAELIADGVHVVKEMMQLIYDHLGSDRIILITDAMRAKGLKDGDYELGGQPVRVTGNRATLADGSLAGSVLKMDDGVRNMLSLQGVSFRDIIQMASVNPAKQIGIFDQKGSIAVGKDADVLVVDHSFNIEYTICRGSIAYKEEN